MSDTSIAGGTLHELPDQIRELLLTDDDVHALRDALTPLARNERICWVTSAKKTETQAKRLQRLAEDILAGKKRPCCRP